MRPSSSPGNRARRGAAGRGGVRRSAVGGAARCGGAWRGVAGARRGAAAGRDARS